MVVNILAPCVGSTSVPMMLNMQNCEIRVLQEEVFLLSVFTHLGGIFKLYIFIHVSLYITRKRLCVFTLQLKPDIRYALCNQWFSTTHYRLLWLFLSDLPMSTC